VRVLDELERYSGRRIRINAALADTSIAGLAGLLREETAPKAFDFAFNTSGDAPPLFMIHAYLGGMLGLRRLAELLPANQPVYGLHVYDETALSGGELTISALAQNAVNRIREVQETGQVTMLGQSAGGFIVFEAARIIRESGGPEPSILLMDAPLPHGILGYYWGESILTPREILPNGTRILWEILTRRIPADWSRGRRSHIAAEDDNLIALNVRQLQSMATAIKHYRGQPYAGNITLMRTRQGLAMATGRRYLGWASVTQGNIEVIDVPGAHVSMLHEPHLSTLAEKLVGWLSRR
jgi:thioesterase domain-containing protein